ncbi:MAG: sulfotransferase domain-containing protein [Phycisphaerales bacterium]
MTLVGGEQLPPVKKVQSIVNLKIRLRSISHYVTWFVGTRFPEAIPLVFVVGYPKSGTTWACQIVADYLQLPYPRSSLLPIGFPAVVHGHERVWKRYGKGVYVVRDGRDSLVSLYFWLIRGVPDGDHPHLTSRQRRMLPGLVNKANLGDNIAPFMERQMRRPVSPRVNWADHVRSYFEVDNPNVVLLRYEDLLANESTALAKAMSQLTGEEPNVARAAESLKRYSFRRQSGRDPGQEVRSAFLRKGQAGDWKNHFTHQAAEIFDHYCGDTLIAAGYEADHAWVDSVRSSDEDVERATAAPSEAGA